MMDETQLVAITAAVTGFVTWSLNKWAEQRKAMRQEALEERRELAILNQKQSEAAEAADQRRSDREELRLEKAAERAERLNTAATLAHQAERATKEAATDVLNRLDAQDVIMRENTAVVVSANNFNTKVATLQEAIHGTQQAVLALDTRVAVLEKR